uniref:Phage protein n=1 Tax=Vibrio phage P018-4 TaxID=3229728 RepID=A0AB39AJP7_9CAUD
MSKEAIKEVIKEMIESGEIRLIVETSKDYNNYDGFGNTDGLLEDVTVEAYLEVKDEE